MTKSRRRFTNRYFGGAVRVKTFVHHRAAVAYTCFECLGPIWVGTPYWAADVEKLHDRCGREVRGPEGGTMSTVLTEPFEAAVESDVAARYGIYVLDEQGDPLRIAECERDAIGSTLVRLAEDRIELEDDRTPQNFGVKDQVERRWISGLWNPR